MVLFNDVETSFSHRGSLSKSYFPKTIRDWNKLSPDVKQLQSRNIFKTRIKSLYVPLVQNSNIIYNVSRICTKVPV